MPTEISNYIAPNNILFDIINVLSNMKYYSYYINRNLTYYTEWSCPVFFQYDIFFCFDNLPDEPNCFKIIAHDPLAKNSSTSIYPVIASFIITNKKEIKKIQTAHSEVLKKTCYAGGELEFFQSKQIKHLYVKSPLIQTTIQKKTTWLFVLKRMPGQDLFNYYYKNIRTKIIDVNPLFSLSKQLLDAMKTQILAYCLLHKDIKLENIIIDPTTLEVNFIDYAFSHHYNDFATKEEIKGTPGYIAPEILLKKYLYFKEKPDMYSLGIIFQILWRLKSINKQLTETTIEQIYNYHYQNQLDYSVLKQLCILTAHMVAVNPNKRYSFYQTFRVFNAIMNAFKNNQPLVPSEQTLPRFTPTAYVMNQDIIPLQKTDDQNPIPYTHHKKSYVQFSELSESIAQSAEAQTINDIAYQIQVAYIGQQYTLKNASGQNHFFFHPKRHHLGCSESTTEKVSATI